MRLNAAMKLCCESSGFVAERAVHLPTLPAGVSRIFQMAASYCERSSAVESVASAAVALDRLLLLDTI
ncbi:hypothetical protein C0Q70_16222 [Pomacea canaliculata]|uniref:Uncharacterized protein n=1 Tax=Pomacea canaliculata TaxID=400727 RepID=A0A2T7NP84_POMCA|nr:hypothetical protein C0Q70_16222 [Pomacea canaliculata]